MNPPGRRLIKKGHLKGCVSAMGVGAGLNQSSLRAVLPLRASALCASLQILRWGEFVNLGTRSLLAIAKEQIRRAAGS